MLLAEATRFCQKRVNLVDENDARFVLLRLLEELAYSLGTYADEHLVEARACAVKERDACFTSDCS